MNSYLVKKHWWFWVGPVVWSLILCPIIFPPIIILTIAFLRWKLDKIEVKDGCLYSRIGIIHIDKKTIPLDKISFITEKTNIIAQCFGFGTIQIQSSAFAKDISYDCVSNPSEFVQFVNNVKK